MKLIDALGETDFRLSEGGASSDIQMERCSRGSSSPQSSTAEDSVLTEEITVEVTDNVGEWTKFLKKQYKRELAELSREYPHNHSLIIDYRKILNNRLAFELLRSPGGKVIGGDIKDAIVQNKLLKLKDGQDPDLVNIRFTNLPQKTNVRDIRADQINTFVAIEGGILRKTTEVRPRIVTAVFRCRSCDKNTDRYPPRATGGSTSPTSVRTARGRPVSISS